MRVTVYLARSEPKQGLTPRCIAWTTHVSNLLQLMATTA